MYLTYADDSGSDKKAPRIVIGAALIRHEFIQEIESVAGMVVERIIPDDRLDKFEEFHACELFAGEGIFEGIDREVRKQALIVLLRQVSRFNIPFIYSAVDKKKLTTKALGSANPIDVAFRMCALGVEEWIKVNDGNALALLICDDTNDQGLKRELRNSFRSLRPKFLPPAWLSGRITHLHDEMYFSTSKDSIGMQIADACAWVVRRSLGANDVPELYDHIRSQVICAKVEDDWSKNRDVFLEYEP